MDEGDEVSENTVIWTMIQTCSKVYSNLSIIA